MRALRPLKKELGFAQRRTEELGQRLVEQKAAAKQLSESNGQLKTKVDELLKLNQQLELPTARASVATQEQIVSNMLQRLGATSPEPDLAVKKQAMGSIQGTTRVAKNPIKTGTWAGFCGFLHESLPTLNNVTAIDLTRSDFRLRAGQRSGKRIVRKVFRNQDFFPFVRSLFPCHIGGFYAYRLAIAVEHKDHGPPE